MLVVMEGPDGSGKSMLIREFNSATNYAHLVVDRLHLSHLVYAHMFKRKEYTDNKLRKKAETTLKDFLRINNVLIVYVKAGADVLKERISRRGEDPTNGPDVAVTMAMYEHWIKFLEIEDRVLTIDTTGEPEFSDLTARITKKIKAMR